MNGRTKMLSMGAMALALAAGTATAQQQDQNQMYKSDQSWQQSQNQSGQGTFVSQLRSADLTILQKDTTEGKTCVCILDHGQLVSCQIDGQDVSLDRVQLKGENKITILDENKSQKVAEIKIPENTQRFTSGSGSSQRFGSNESRFQQGSQGQSGYGQSSYQQDQYSRNYNTGQDSRYQQDQGYSRGSYSQDTWRSQPQQYGQSDYQRSEYRNYNQGQSQPGYREDRFYTERQSQQPRDQYSYNERYYPSEQRDRYTYSERTYQQNQQNQQPDRYTYESRNYSSQPQSTYYSERSYPDRSSSSTQQRSYSTNEGNYSSSRPMLGVMMSEADRSDLRNASVDTNRYSQGILVESVNPGSPAEMAGLQRGDVIVLIDGSQPATPDMMRDTLGRKDFNDTVRLLTIHNGQERNINVRLTQPQGMGMQRNYYTTGGETQWNHRMPQQIPPEPNSEFQPGNSNWRPNMERNHYWYQDDRNNYGPR